MAVTAVAVMRHLNNYFETGCIRDEFTVRWGEVENLPPAPYICVQGSMYHDGVYEMQGGKPVGMAASPDETFRGTVWLLRPPNDFLKLCEEIAKYDEHNPAGSLVSESFGSYSRTRGTGAGGSVAWQDVFADALRPYRRMWTEVG